MIKEQQTLLPATARISMIKQALFEKNKKKHFHTDRLSPILINKHFLAGLSISTSNNLECVLCICVIYSRKENYRDDALDNDV